MQCNEVLRTDVVLTRTEVGLVHVSKWSKFRICRKTCNEMVCTEMVMYRSGPPLTLKMHQMRLAAGLRPDPLGELTALPQTQRLAGFKSGVRDKGRKKGKRQDEIDS